MIGSPRSYSSTKDSGVACLGRVPTHWKVRRLGQIGELSKGRGGSKADEVPSGIPCVRYGDLYTSHEFFVHASRSAIRQTEAENYTRIKFGDALFAGSGETIDEIGKSAVCLMRSEARCGGDIILFRCQVPVDARYLGYATGCRPAVLQKAAMGRGVTVMHVYADQLKRFALPIPPLSEQAAIVGFLDYVDRRIRRYVRSKDRLIALLEEQKQAVIHQAVTGQIDVWTGRPYPAYKDSAVEWLGEVPEHWEVLALKRVLERLVDCEHKTAPRVADSDFYVIRTTAIRDGSIRWEGTYCTDRASYKKWTRRGVPQAGDVIFTREAPVGEACLVPTGRRVCLGQRTVLLRPDRKRYDPSFLVHMVYGGPPRIRVELASQGSTVGHFNVDDIGWMPILRPPLDEQRNIVKALGAFAGNVTRAQRCLRLDLEALREYRTRLIADVVTGKLDVREAAAALPEVDPLEVEEDQKVSIGSGSTANRALPAVDDSLPADT